MPVGAGRGARAVEDGDGLADLDAVAVKERRLLDALTVEVGAVGRVEVAKGEGLVGVLADLEVCATERGVGELDRVVLGAADGDA